MKIPHAVRRRGRTHVAFAALLLLVIAIPLAVGACGNSDGAPAEGTTSFERSNLVSGSPAKGGIASTTAVPVSAGAAGPEALAATSCAHNVQRQNPNGPLLTAPKIYFLFWTNYWASGTGKTEFNSYTGTWASLASSDGFYKQLAEYGIGDGQYLGASVQNPNLGSVNPIKETTIATQLVSEIGTLGVPSNDPNTLYVIMLPNGFQADYDVSNRAFGHHQTTKKNGASVWYAVIEYNTNIPQNDEVVSHEIYEAATDPDLSGGYCEGPCAASEIGDLCNLNAQTLENQTVQKVWSQGLCSCLGAPTAVLENIVIGGGTEQLYHSVRLPTGFWTNYAQPPALPGLASGVEMQNVGNFNTQVMALVQNDLWHTIRDQNGNWSNWGDATVVMGASGATNGILHFGMADVINSAVQHEMQLCATGGNGVLYHAIRHADGSWTTLNNTQGVLGNPGKLGPTDCAGFGSTLQLLAATTTGAVYHAIRNSDGSWAGLNLLSPNIAGDPVFYVAVANVAQLLHALALTNHNGKSILYHQIRMGDGSWTGWAAPPGSGSFSFTSVSAGAVNGELHVVAIDRAFSGTVAGRPWHVIRHADGTWSSFGDVGAQSGMPESTVFNITATGSPAVSY